MARNKAVNQLYSLCFDSVKYFIVNNSGNTQDAEDIFQEGLLALYNRLIEGKFQGKSTLKTYLFSICKYLWINKLRTINRVSVNSLENVMELPNEEFHSVDTVSLEKIFSQLRGECQEILKLFYFESMSMEQIKSVFNLGSTQAAKNKKHRCLQHLIELTSLSKKNMEDFIK